MGSTHDYEIDVRNENIMIYIDGQFFHRSDAKVSVMVVDIFWVMEFGKA